MRKGDIVLGEVRAFMKSRVILTACELDIFTRLDSAPATAEELAADRHLDTRAATRVLDCLITMGLLEKENGYIATRIAVHGCPPRTRRAYSPW